MNATAQEISDLKNKLVSHFADFESSINGESKSAIHQVRKAAIEKFKELGFPTTKNEEWKYTNLLPATKIEWKEANTETASEFTTEEINSYFVKGLEASTLVFINGFYAEEFSDIKEEANGVIITSFRRALKVHRNIVEQHFAKYISYDYNGLVALNTAYAMDGAFIFVPKGKQVQNPIQFVFISTNHVMSNVRNLVVAEENTEVTIIENTFSQSGAETFNNIVTEAVAAQNAIINYYKNQLEDESANQVNTTQFYQLKDSRCNTATITLGGKLVRNDLNFMLDDKGIEAHMHGLFIPSGSQHFDNHTYADHAKPQCFSNEYYKGIMMDKSTGVFNGKIMVRQDAQKTNAYQSNKNVLLSDDAKIDTKPQLEIFADDVKCSHGATVGQLDEEALFYLRSRGIGEKEAKSILTYAFASDILENIQSQPLREYLDERIREKLGR